MIFNLRRIAGSVVFFLCVLATAAEPSRDITSAPTAAIAHTIVELGAWARDYAAGTTSLPEGREIATDRARYLKELANSDPAAVLSAAMDERSRAELPAEIRSLLEQPISTIGDLTVVSVCLRDGGHRLEHEVSIDGKTYRAAVVGRRMHQPSKRGIPLQGVLIDDTLVLSEDAIRQLDQPPAGATVIDTEPIRDPAAAVLGQCGGQVYRFPSLAALKQAEATIRQTERTPGPILSRSARDIITHRQVAALQVGTPEWTKGDKKVLVIRVDYADAPGDPKALSGTYSLSKMQTIMDTQVAPFFANSSFHQFSLSTTITKIYRMKDPVAEYAKALVKVLRDEALAAAKVDYPGHYDLTIIVTTDLGYYPDSNYKYAGLASLGESGLIINGDFTPRVLTHELGHNLGLHHANTWTVTDGNPASAAGTSTEYGDVFDIMGNGSDVSGSNYDFSAGEKYQIRWLADSQVKDPTGVGTYRIYGADDASRGPTDLVALQVAKDTKRTYWISYRPNFLFGTSRATNVTNGAYICWQSEELYGQQNLLDMVTPGNTPDDACLPVGSTFIDPDTGLMIETLGKGGTGSGQYLDVRVTVKNNIRVTSQPVDQTIDLGANATFKVTVNSANATFQWQVSADNGITWQNTSGEHYTGTQTATLGVLGVTDADSRHLFRCQVTVDGQTVNSGTATLKVGVPPKITGDIDNVSISIRPGETTTLTVGVSGNGLSYFWYCSDGKNSFTVVFDGGPYSGATTNALTIKGDESLNGLAYSVGVYNAYGYVQSGWARLNVGTATNHLLNLSTRCRVGTGDSIGIMGLVIHERSTVLLRAAGPSLKPGGVADPLPHPVLKLMKGSTAVATNTGWKSATAEARRLIRETGQRVGAFAFTDDADSALVPVLEPGVYTVQVSDTNDKTGVALLEAYLDNAAGSPGEHLLNLSSRIHVGTGDDLGIAGLVLEQPAKVLIRAVGPSLAAQGVADVLRKPVLKLVKNGTVVASNTGWRGNAAEAEKLAAAAAKCGAFPLGSPDDSALLVTLAAGAYSALVSGANDTTGNAMIEVYLTE